MQPQRSRFVENFGLAELPNQIQTFVEKGKTAREKVQNHRGVPAGLFPMNKVQGVDREIATATPAEAIQLF